MWGIRFWANFAATWGAPAHRRFENSGPIVLTRNDGMNPNNAASCIFCLLLCSSVNLLASSNIVITSMTPRFSFLARLSGRPMLFVDIGIFIPSKAPEFSSLSRSSGYRYDLGPGQWCDKHKGQESLHQCVVTTSLMFLICFSGFILRNHKIVRNLLCVSFGG